MQEDPDSNFTLCPCYQIDRFIPLMSFCTSLTVLCTDWLKYGYVIPLIDFILFMPILGKQDITFKTRLMHAFFQEGYKGQNNVKCYVACNFNLSFSKSWKSLFSFSFKDLKEN